MNNILALSFGFITLLLGFFLVKRKSQIVNYMWLLYLAIFLLNICFTHLFHYDLEVSPYSSIYFSLITISILFLINSSNSLLYYEVDWNFATIILFFLVLIAIIIISLNRINIAYDILFFGDLRLLRHYFYQGENQINITGFVNYAAIIAGYFRIPFVLLSLSLFKTKYSNYVIYLIILAYFPMFLNSIITVSRGMSILVLTDVFIIYNIIKVNYKESLSNFKISFLSKLTLFSSITLILFFLNRVTSSRFGDDDGGLLSLIKYLSHSIYFFTSSVNEYSDYLFGAFSFNLFDNVSDGWNVNELVLATDTGFFTYLGALHIDFGYMGGFILILTVFLFIYPFKLSNQHKISKSILYFFVVQQMFMGIFVWGINIGVSFLMCFIISRIFRIINN